MTDKLIGILSKIEWTKKHITNLDVAVRTFLESSPYKFTSKHDPDTRKLTYYVSHVEPISGDIAQITGDAMCNMASILDHLAYRLFLKGGTGGDGRHVYFPIDRKATTMAEYISKRQGKVQGIPAHIVAAIDALEPYQRGKGHQLWVLSELNNLSKHRDLIAVGSRLRHIDLFIPGPPKFVSKNPVPFGTFPEICPEVVKLPANIPGFPIQGAGLRMTPHDRLCPLKVGDILGTHSPDADPNQQTKFAFDVALNEPGIIEAEPLIETVHHLADLVSKIVDQFTPYL